jgi:hypothetical protein
LETIFDWISVAIFSGLIVLFLQRSSEDEPRDSLWQYLVAASGCAIANVVGNAGYPFLGALTLTAVLGFVWFVLHPLEGWKKP